MKNTLLQDKLVIAGREFHSRLMLGTGKYFSHETMQEAIVASGTQIVTVALRRVDLDNPDYDILTPIDKEKILILPNTSGAQNAEEAVRLARLARAGGISDWVKLEITSAPRTLLPDGEETLKAAKILVKEGFIVLPYIHADPILAKKLEDAGCATVMPLGAPIGTNKGLETREFIQMIIEEAMVPVVIDAGIGKPSDAAEALEMGADAVMVNTAVATADNPVLMALAFKQAVEAGRNAFLAGIAPSYHNASASSPLEWLSK